MRGFARDTSNPGNGSSDGAGSCRPLSERGLGCFEGFVQEGQSGGACGFLGGCGGGGRVFVDDGATPGNSGALDLLAGAAAPPVDYAYASSPVGPPRSSSCSRWAITGDADSAACAVVVGWCGALDSKMGFDATSGNGPECGSRNGRVCGWRMDVVEPPSAGGADRRAGGVGILLDCEHSSADVFGQCGGAFRSSGHLNCRGDQGRKGSGNLRGGGPRSGVDCICADRRRIGICPAGF